ncbi:MAG: aldehyde ferredoxin oxidoreductase family protein [bacterium]
MPKGYMGKVLHVDLATGKTRVESEPDETYERLLSGAGLAAKVLFDSIPKGADPLGPDNVLGIVSGLLTGTGALLAGRWMVAAKSPLTGGYGESNCGGTFAPAIKRCGYDGIFFHGISPRPVYLRVAGGRPELVDASHLWGMDATEAEERIQEENADRKVQVAVIGQSGENLSRISGVCNDRGRIAARSGLGAVMGSKRLKAVALSGKETVGAEDPGRIKTINEKFLKWLNASKPFEKYLPSGLARFLGRLYRVSPIGMAQDGNLAKMAFRQFGTIVGNVLSSESGDSPVKNWKGAGYRDFPIDTHSGKLDPQRIVDRQFRKYNCYSCPLGCGGLCKVTSGPYPVELTHKPEYETCCSFGALLLNNDLDAVFKITEMLNRAGMDTISAGATVAFAMECYENGILSKDDLDGIDLHWGNAPGVIDLLQKMIDRQGIGDTLADGVKRAAEKIGKGSDRYAVHAGGQELPMHDPRFDPGFLVCYELEPTPGRHTNVSYQWAELFAMHKIFKGLPKPPQLYRVREKYKPEGKHVLQVAGSKYVQLANGLGCCLFALQMAGNYPLVEYANAVTGWDRKAEDYLRIGERIQNLRQAFNAREGLRPRMDFLMNPRAAGSPPLTYGPLKGVRLDRESLHGDFCRAMGWDEQTGIPTRAKLEELGLEDASRALYGRDSGRAP